MSSLDRPGASVSVRLFGILRSQWVEAGRAPMFDTATPEAGLSARDLAEGIGLSVDLIEGVFINQKLLGLDSHVAQGDRVAFVPFGTPGPHRVFLGLYEAGKHRG